ANAASQYSRSIRSISIRSAYSEELSLLRLSAAAANGTATNVITTALMNASNRKIRVRFIQQRFTDKLSFHGSVLATRNPMMTSRKSAGFLSRVAERRSHAG